MTALPPRGLHRTRARGRDRGVTLIEMSLVALIVFTFFLVIFEFGLLFRDNLTATDAAADATRIGAIVGPDVASDGSTADYAIARAVRQGLASLDDSDVQYIVVFKASGGGGAALNQVPLACRNGTSIAGICNAYTANAAFNAVEAGNAAYFTCAGANTAACKWNPETRKDGPTSSQVETLGVYVKIVRPGYTGLFAKSWTIERASISRLEPGVTDP